MPYHQLPIAFVANDYLCEFLLAQGLRETTDLDSEPGCRDFQQSQGSEALCITVNQPAAQIEVALQPLLAHSYCMVPAAALVLLLTMEPGRPIQQPLFLCLMAELIGQNWQGERLSELAATIEAAIMSNATPSAAARPCRLPPLAGQQ